MDSNPRSPVDPMVDSAGVPCPDKFVGLTQRAGVLEEMRRWDEAAPLRKPSPLGAEIDDRPSLRPRRRNAPTQLNKLDLVLTPPKDRRGLGRPDIVARFEIGGRDREYDGDADL